MADPCKALKDALDEAEGNSTTFEYWMNKHDEYAAAYRAEAQDFLAATIYLCTDSENRLIVECVIANWVRAYELLEDARKARETADSYSAEWQRWDYEAHKRRKKYCACKNGETPP